MSATIRSQVWAHVFEHDAMLRVQCPLREVTTLSRFLLSFGGRQSSLTVLGHSSYLSVVPPDRGRSVLDRV